MAGAPALLDTADLVQSHHAVEAFAHEEGIGLAQVP
jgi:hypothetical protein